MDLKHCKREYVQPPKTKDSKSTQIHNTTACSSCYNENMLLLCMSMIQTVHHAQSIPK
jgi:hypothetical protein